MDPMTPDDIMAGAPPSRWLDLQARARPDAPALRCGDTVLDYRGLHLRARHVAGLLSDAGAVPGTTAVATTTDALTLALLHLGGPLAGVALLPLDPALPAEHREALLRQVRAPLVLSPRLLTDVAVPGPPSDGPPTSLAPAPGDAPYLVIATSGSSGAPKGVVLSGDAIGAHARAANDRLALGPGDAWLVSLPLVHVGGAAILWRCLRAGATAVLGGPFAVERVAATIRSDGISHLSLVPAMLDRLIDALPAPPQTLRCLLIGGAPLSAALAERAMRAGWPIRPTWGMSETCSQAATLTDPERHWRPGLVGRPLDGLEVAVQAPDADGIGRLRLRGAMVMTGYLGPDGAAGHGLAEGGWFVTGDLGRIGADGTIEVIGRADDMLISGGKTISPVAVEALLEDCPDLGAFAVSGVTDPVWGDRLALAYTGQAVPEAVLAWCRAQVPSALRPRLVRRLPALPRSALGKISRRRLRDWLESHGPG